MILALASKPRNLCFFWSTFKLYCYSIECVGTEIPVICDVRMFVLGFGSFSCCLYTMHEFKTRPSLVDARAFILVYGFTVP